MAKVIGTDFNGMPVEIDVDIEKGLLVNDIPEEMEWSLSTLDENEDGEITEFVGGRGKRG